MKIKTLQIKDFRSILSKTVDIDTVNILLGPCGSGKSSIMSALKFVLTGDINKKDIRVGAKAATVELTFTDGNTISRTRKSDSTTCKVNGKTCTATALNEYIEGKVGATVKIIASMCGTEFYEAIEQKDLTKFMLSILPVNISFDKLMEFIKIQMKIKLTKEQIDMFREYLSDKESYDIKDIEAAYAAIYDRRRIVKGLITSLASKCEFKDTLPSESKEDLNKQLSEILLAESKVQDYARLSAKYDQAVQVKANAENRLKELQTQWKSYENLVQPNAEDFAKNKEDKAKFEDAIKRCNQTIATNRSNIQIFQKTLDNLDKPACPLSEKLVCNTDKSGLKTELIDLINKNQKAIADTQIFVARCQEQIDKRNKFIDQYNESMIRYTQKTALEKQISEYIIPTIPDKPVKVQIDDTAVKKEEINQKLSLIMQYDIFQKSKKEYDTLCNELKLLEFGVAALDVTTGVRTLIMKKTIEPLQFLVNQKADTLRKGFKVNLTSDKGLNIEIAPNGTDFVSMHNVSSGEFMFTTYLIMSVIRQITGVRVLLIDNIDKLDKEAFESFISLICEDIEYDNVILGGINHLDTMESVMNTPISVIHL